jgi:hypothetical protein
MEEAKHSGLINYFSTKTNEVYQTVRSNTIIAKGESMVTPYYNSVMGEYISPFVQNVKVNYIIECKNKTEQKGKQVAEKADELARYMVMKLPTDYAKGILAQFGDTKIIKAAKSVADRSLTVAAATADRAICGSLSTFDRQIVDRLCSRPSPELKPKGIDYIPYM